MLLAAYWRLGGRDAAWKQEKPEARKLLARSVPPNPQPPVVRPVERSENGVHYPGDRLGHFVGQRFYTAPSTTSG